MQTEKPILLVEDDNVDAMTVKRALKEIGVAKPLVHVTDGEDAMLYLRNDANEKPCVILLDLNMPRMDGIEFLKLMKADPIIRYIPVVILTTSKNAFDILESFKLSAAGYMVKPVDYTKFVEIIRAVAEYWTLSRLPNRS
jgi:CheY-like chemotaxis protein